MIWELFDIRLAKDAPILILEEWTEIPSITESGLAKYTCSKIQGLWDIHSSIVWMSSCRPFSQLRLRLVRHPSWLKPSVLHVALSEENNLCEPINNTASHRKRTDTMVPKCDNAPSCNHCNYAVAPFGPKV